MRCQTLGALGVGGFHASCRRRSTNDCVAFINRTTIVCSQSSVHSTPQAITSEETIARALAAASALYKDPPTACVPVLCTARKHGIPCAVRGHRRLSDPPMQTPLGEWWAGVGWGLLGIAELRPGPPVKVLGGHLEKGAARASVFLSLPQSEGHRRPPSSSAP